MSEKRRSYSREFKLEAVSMLTDGGVSIAQAARNLGISENSLWRWKKEFEEDPDHAFPGKGHLKPPEDKLARLRRENRRLRQERDILKKAVGIFSRVPK
jgi:transposase